jgi:hypothetical protein
VPVRQSHREPPPAIIAILARPPPHFKAAPPSAARKTIMDLSKLPRRSTTAPAPPAGYCACGAPLRAGARFCDSCGAPVAAAPDQRAFSTGADVGTGAEVWLSVAIGALLLLMQPRLLQFLSHKLFGTFFSPYIDPETGSEVPYTAQLDFWSDLGITLFAFVLILEGLAIAFARRRGVVALAVGLTVLTTAYNLAYLAYTFSSGVAILSAFAVAFGVYIAIFEWRLLQQLRPVRRS